MNGPVIVGVVALALGVMHALLLAVHGADPDGLRVLVRASARTSVVLFSAAFATSALFRLRPSPATRWLLRSRRYVGLSFAVSHALHLAVLGALALVAADFAPDPVTLAGGGLAYLLIAAMAATSSDRAVAWLGPRRWRTLHAVGGWWIWTIFAFDYFTLPFASSPCYLPFAALVAAVLGLRVAAARQLRSRAAAPA